MLSEFLIFLVASTPTVSKLPSWHCWFNLFWFRVLQAIWTSAINFTSLCVSRHLFTKTQSMWTFCPPPIRKNTFGDTSSDWTYLIPRPSRVQPRTLHWCTGGCRLSCRLGAFGSEPQASQVLGFRPQPNSRYLHGRQQPYSNSELCIYDNLSYNNEHDQLTCAIKSSLSLSLSTSASRVNGYPVALNEHNLSWDTKQLLSTVWSNYYQQSLTAIVHYP